MKQIFIAFLVLTSFSTLAASQLFLDSNANKSQISIFQNELLKLSESTPNENIQVDFYGGNKYSSVYPAGDLYIFLSIGKKNSDQNMTKDEYKRLYSIMNYLAEQGFRVMINVKGKISLLKAAIEDDNTSLIIWSGHGNKQGFYDYNRKKVPYDIFKNAGKNLYQFVLSSCYGRTALNNHYKIPSQIKTWAWTGTTNSTEFIKFLISDKWSAKRTN